MKRLIPLIAAVLGCLILMAAPALGEDSKLGNDPVVRVQGKSITEAEFFFACVVRSGEGTLRSLMNSMVLADEADRRGIQLDEGELAEELARTFTPEDLVDFGRIFDMELVREMFRRELLSRKMIEVLRQEVIDENGLEATDDEVHEYFAQIAQRYVSPERVRLSVIQLSSEVFARQTLEKLKHGEDFAEAARKYSEDQTTAQRGGDLGVPIARGQFPPELAAIERTAFSLEVGEVGPIVPVADTFYLVMVTEKMARVEPKLETYREAIESAIMEEKIQPYLAQKVSALAQKAEIEVLYPFFTEAELDTVTFEGDSGLTPQDRM